MRNLFLVVGLLLLHLPLSAADARPLISREAAKYASAWKRSDPKTIVAYMPSHVIQQLGGRASIVAQLQEQFAQARSLGATSLDASLGPPTVPKQIGRWLASVLSVTAVLHSAHLDLTQQTHVLALSADQGKRWFFLVLYDITQADLIGWFPEFRGKVFVPTPPAPKLKVVY